MQNFADRGYAIEPFEMPETMRTLLPLAANNKKVYAISDDGFADYVGFIYQEGNIWNACNNYHPIDGLKTCEGFQAEMYAIEFLLRLWHGAIAPNRPEEPDNYITDDWLC